MLTTTPKLAGQFECGYAKKHSHLLLFCFAVAKNKFAIFYQYVNTKQLNMKQNISAKLLFKAII